MNRAERRKNIKKYKKLKFHSIIHARQFLSLKNWKEAEMSDLDVKKTLKQFYGIDL
jgi:hypothetical protein